MKNSPRRRKEHIKWPAEHEHPKRASENSRKSNEKIPQIVLPPRTVVVVVKSERKFITKTQTLSRRSIRKQAFYTHLGCRDEDEEVWWGFWASELSPWEGILRLLEDDATRSWEGFSACYANNFSRFSSEYSEILPALSKSSSMAHKRPSSAQPTSKFQASQIDLCLFQLFVIVHDQHIARDSFWLSLIFVVSGRIEWMDGMLNGTPKTQRMGKREATWKMHFERNRKCAH